MVRSRWVHFQSQGVLLVWFTVWQGPIALAVGAGGVVLGILFLSSVISLFFLPLSGRKLDVD